MENKHPPLAKQLLGSVAGALVALGFYGVYQFSSPHLSAYLTIPWSGDDPPSGEVRLPKDASEAEIEKLSARARRIAEEFSHRATYTSEEPSSEEDTMEGSPVEPEVPVPAPVEEEPAVPEEVSAPAPVEDPVPVMEEEELEAVRTVEPPALPSSGIGTLLLICFALVAAIGFRFRGHLSIALALK
ncbi:MAG: hypothetical protein AAB489_05435 [Patescibacteria group bacterium]